MFGEIDPVPPTDKPDNASLYRTRWLMAHNHLHKIVHEGGDPQAIYEDYLRELSSAEEIARQPA